MRFQVPQFIEIEDKIFGPLTFKEFVYLVGGAGLAYTIYKLTPLLIAIILDIPVIGLALALSFYKVNGKPFINVLESALYYFKNNKLYIWKKEDAPITPEKQVEQMVKQINVPKLSDSKLKDLTWSLDINETIYSHDKGKLASRGNLLK